MSRAYDIAFKTRLYGVLSERPEYLTTDRAEVIERLLDAQVPLGEIDRTLILGASELDRLCAHAVRTLTRRSPAAVLDVLGMLDPDRLTAMHFALPEKRRASLRKDAAWAYHVDHAPPETAEAVAEVAGWAQDSQASVAERGRLFGSGTRRGSPQAVPARTLRPPPGGRARRVPCVRTQSYGPSACA